MITLNIFKIKNALIIKKILLCHRYMVGVNLKKLLFLLNLIFRHKRSKCLKTKLNDAKYLEVKMSENKIK